MKFTTKRTIKSKIIGFVSNLNIIGSFREGYNLGKNIETDLIYGCPETEEVGKKEPEQGK